MKSFYVYIMTNRRHGVLYVGMTGDLESRVWEHKIKAIPWAFTARYNCRMLVYYEEYPDAWEAIGREKQIKGWRRDKKIALIEAMNPEWRDLSSSWYDRDWQEYKVSG